jgi:hypothetical protein
MSDLGKNLLRLSFALLKHQAELWLGEETIGVAADTLIDIGGEELQAKLDAALTTQAGQRELLNAAQRADAYFQQHCTDTDLRGAFTLSFGNLESVQIALSDIPKAMDSEEVETAIQEALKRDIPRLRLEQINMGAQLYTESLQRALVSVKEFTLPILAQVVLEIRNQLNGIGAGQERIEKRLNELIPSQQQWLRPTPPRPSKPMIGREDEFGKVKDLLLKPGSRTAITATVQGAPGVGKTVLAEHLAIGLDSEFPGGVLFERLGVDFREPILCNLILKHWTTFAFEGKEPDQTTQPTPDEVRALLAGHGTILVVLDDLWHEKAIQPLLDALPTEACLLITTRSQKIARDLHGQIFPLDILSSEDALALLHSRLPSFKVSDDPFLKHLAKSLGFHAQALDIAAGSLARLTRNRWENAISEMEHQVLEGTGFGELHLPGDEQAENHVESALYSSYKEMNDEAKFRFRLLGTFAPDSHFRIEAISGIWKCALEQAEDQLSIFVELGLLNRYEQPNPGTSWQQHTLLRAYALALLNREGEKEAAHTLHAKIYNDLMGQADDQQIYYQMLSDYPQIRHAFAWSIENDLDLALSLAGNTANLQAAFYLVMENYNWAKQLVQKSQERDIEFQVNVQVALANALSRLANLPDEDRRARLLEALHAYNEALKFRRPDTAPLAYAMTQNNRGNVLRDLASSPDEDRRARLLEALHAYNEALNHYRPDTAPLAYAMTQGNLAFLYLDLSAFPEENRKDQLRRAIQCTVTARLIFIQVGHAPYTQQASRQLKYISEQAGDLFVDIWNELNFGEMPDWLK